MNLAQLASWFLRWRSRVKWIAVGIGIGCLLWWLPANAYERTPTGAEITPPITSTFTNSDMSEIMADCVAGGVNRWQGWYQTSSYAEVVGSYTGIQTTSTFSYEWTPTSATGTAAQIRIDCSNDDTYIASTWLYDSFDWIEGETTSTTSTTTMLELEELTSVIFGIFIVLNAMLLLAMIQFTKNL